MPLLNPLTTLGTISPSWAMAWLSSPLNCPNRVNWRWLCSACFPTVSGNTRQEGGGNSYLLLWACPGHSSTPKAASTMFCDTNKLKGNLHRGGCRQGRPASRPLAPPRWRRQPGCGHGHMSLKQPRRAVESTCGMLKKSREKRRVYREQTAGPAGGARFPAHGLGGMAPDGGLLCRRSRETTRTAAAGWSLGSRRTLNLGGRVRRRLAGGALWPTPVFGWVVVTGTQHKIIYCVWAVST